jgi:hypothetical protein
LELTNSLSPNPELLTHFFEGLRFVAVQPEPLKDYLALTVIKNLKQVAHLVAAKRMQSIDLRKLPPQRSIFHLGVLA